MLNQVFILLSWKVISGLKLFVLARKGKQDLKVPRQADIILR